MVPMQEGLKTPLRASAPRNAEDRSSALVESELA
jgi:hypothetical protein